MGERVARIDYLTTPPAEAARLYIDRHGCGDARRRARLNEEHAGTAANADFWHQVVDEIHRAKISETTRSTSAS